MKRLVLPLVLFAMLTACSPPLRDEAGGRESGAFHLACYNAAGRLKWSETAHNALADEGEQLFLNVVLRGGTAPANTYLRLYNTTPEETSTLAGIAAYEPSGNGYSPQALPSSSSGWLSLALDSGDYMATSVTKTFTASGGTIGPVTHLVLATSSDNSGKLVSYAALSTTRTLADGDSLQVTYRLKMQ
ncbi:MAG: hypothetical protein GYA56_08480 [Geobacteraceae bacterium]|nr:hypothetical protein [Geobacteraceae bacterium]